MRVCLILEGCYPYIRGGVSTWTHGYISANPNIDFVLWTIHSSQSDAMEPMQYSLEVSIVDSTGNAVVPMALVSEVDTNVYEIAKFYIK